MPRGVGKREEKYLTRGAGVKEKLVQNKEAVVEAINARYSELRKQLDRDRGELLRQIAEVDQENSRKLGELENGNQNRLKEINIWLDKARGAESKPDRAGFLELIKNYQRIAGECAQIFTSSHYQLKGLDLQSFDYIPDKTNTRLGTLLLNSVEPSQR